MIKPAFGDFISCILDSFEWHSVGFCSSFGSFPARKIGDGCSFMQVKLYRSIIYTLPYIDDFLNLLKHAYYLFSSRNITYLAMVVWRLTTGCDFQSFSFISAIWCSDFYAFSTLQQTAHGCMDNITLVEGWDENEIISTELHSTCWCLSFGHLKGESFAVVLLGCWLTNMHPWCKLFSSSFFFKKHVETHTLITSTHLSM